MRSSLVAVASACDIAFQVSVITPPAIYRLRACSTPDLDQGDRIFGSRSTLRDRSDTVEQIGHLRGCSSGLSNELSDEVLSLRFTIRYRQRSKPHFDPHSHHDFCRLTISHTYKLRNLLQTSAITANEKLNNEVESFCRECDHGLRSKQNGSKNQDLRSKASERTYHRSQIRYSSTLVGSPLITPCSVRCLSS